MKILYFLPLFIGALLLTGCETTSGSSGSADEPEAAASDASAGEKTAYDGGTGSGLLMERYKSGSIDGYRE